MSFDTTYFKAMTDSFTATVAGAGDVAGQFLVQPHVVEADGQDMPVFPALAADAIKPEIGDKVLCITTRNEYTHEYVNRFNRSTGGNLIIIGVYADDLTRDATLRVLKDFFVTGAATLGTGSEPMVLGDGLAAWAAKVDAAINALYAWGATGVPPGPTGGIAPFPGTPTPPAWSPDNLSENHTLD